VQLFTDDIPIHHWQTSIDGRARQSVRCTAAYRIVCEATATVSKTPRNIPNTIFMRNPLGCPLGSSILRLLSVNCGIFSQHAVILFHPQIAVSQWAERLVAARWRHPPARSRQRSARYIGSDMTPPKEKTVSDGSLYLCPQTRKVRRTVLVPGPHITRSRVIPGIRSPVRE
jgi:hypothetical protein